MIQTFPQTASIHEIQRSYRALFNKIKERKEPLYLLKNNKPEVVVIDYSAWENIVHELEKSDLLDSIRIAEQEKAKGKIKKLDTLDSLVPSSL